MPRDAPVTRATLLFWLLVIGFLPWLPPSPSVDGQEMDLHISWIISYYPTILFGFSSNGSIRGDAGLHPNPGAAELHAGRGRPRAAPHDRHRRDQEIGG